MKNVRDLIGEDELEERMVAARARAEWELGSSSWAGVIVGAFLHPEEDADALAREMDPTESPEFRAALAAADLRPHEGGNDGS